jgi:TetR/AcrR family transcriptional repressor of uid operon
MTSTVETLPPEAAPDRRTRVLDAAEQCFVRAGFHRTTMQDVAAEVGMSPGNLYRYFPSKDALVEGLAERDRADMVGDFTALDGPPDDLLGALGAIGRKHLVEQPREKAILCLEIWAEATRNPAFAAMTAEFEREVTGRLGALFTQARDRGLIAPEVDPESLALLVSTLGDGLFVRRAVSPDFDADRGMQGVFAVIEAACAGRIHLPRSSHSQSK